MAVSDMGAHPSGQLREVHNARLTCKLPALPENNQRGYTADAELSRNSLLLLGIDFRQLHTRFKLCGRLLKNGRHRLAGPAPRRPKIDHYGDAAMTDMLLEAGVVKFHGMSIE